MIPFQSKTARLSQFNVAGNSKRTEVFMWCAKHFCPVFKNVEFLDICSRQPSISNSTQVRPVGGGRSYMLIDRRTDGRVLWRFIVIGKNKIHWVLHVKYAILCPILTKFGFRQIFTENPNIKFHGKFFQWEPLWHIWGQTDGRADIRKVKRDLGDCANAPNK